MKLNIFEKVLLINPRSGSHTIDDLVFDPQNANIHDEKNIDAIKNSLERFGQDQVLIIREDNNQIIKGNGRAQAARELGWTHIAAVAVSDDEITAIGDSFLAVTTTADTTFPL